MKILLKSQQNRILGYMLVGSIIFIGGIIQENILALTKNNRKHCGLKQSPQQSQQTLTDQDMTQSKELRTQLLKKGIIPKEASYWQKE